MACATRGRKEEEIELTRLVEEDELRLFQLCPALLRFSREDRVTPEEDPFSETLLTSLRWIWTRITRTGFIPKRKVIRQQWAVLVTKSGQSKRLDKAELDGILVDGAVTLMSIFDDVLDGSLNLVTGKIPVDLRYDGRILRTYPEATLLDRELRPVILNYIPSGRVKEFSNDIVSRARVLAMHKQLKRPVTVINYRLRPYGKRVYSSEILCDDRLDTDLAHATRAISDGYGIPPTICPLGASCLFYRECYY